MFFAVKRLANIKRVYILKFLRNHALVLFIGEGRVYFGWVCGCFFVAYVVDGLFFVLFCFVCVFTVLFLLIFTE